LKAENPEKFIVAVPVAPPDSVAKVEPEVDDLIVLETPSLFWAVGAFYSSFDQTTDEEVIELLKR
jgi:predicted phosphoribosyltransferase